MNITDKITNLVKEEVKQELLKYHSFSIEEEDAILNMVVNTMADTIKSKGMQNKNEILNILTRKAPSDLNQPIIKDVSQNLSAQLATQPYINSTQAVDMAEVIVPTAFDVFARKFTSDSSTSNDAIGLLSYLGLGGGLTKLLTGVKGKGSFFGGLFKK